MTKLKTQMLDVPRRTVCSIHRTKAKNKFENAETKAIATGIISCKFDDEKRQFSNTVV
jgi:hypothetical protein